MLELLAIVERVDNMGNNDVQVMVFKAIELNAII